ncbi:MAG TPA: LysR substrate-binding domain-containing protein [Terriglobia bacterium]|nr:LysR substrate-binding domain-containing protein [Terriglobia bacterium]
MNISWLTLRDLEYLVAVADQQHFGKAAESCNVSQPALSAQIRKIEDFLGLRLFERSNRTVVITPVGDRVARQARVVLEEARKILTLVQATNQPLSASFRLGAIATLGPYLMPYFLEGLRKRFPKVELLMKEGLTDALIADLRTGALDAVLAAPTFADDGLRLIPLFYEPFLLAAPKGHKLAAKEPLRVKDLHSEEMVLLEDGHCLRDQIVEACPTNRRGNFREFQATSLETLRHLVASGFGYTLIPRLAIASNDRLKNLVSYRPFAGKPVGREIVLVCRERFGRMADIDALAAFIRENLPPGVTPL